MIFGNSESTNTSKPNVAFTEAPRQKIYLLLVLLLIGAVAVGYLAYINGVLGRLGFSGVPGAQSNLLLSERQLPFSKSILLNPVIYQWKGSVAGEVLTTDKDSFTIKNNGSTLKIFFLKNYTRIFDINSDKQLTSSDQLKIGSMIRGGVLITQKDGEASPSAVPSDVVGEILNVEKSTK